MKFIDCGTAGTQCAGQSPLLFFRAKYLISVSRNILRSIPSGALHPSSGRRRGSIDLQNVDFVTERF